MLRKLLISNLYFLVKDMGFICDIIKNNNLMTTIIYVKDNMTIMLIVEEVESYFNLEVHVVKNGKTYCISDNINSWKAHYDNNEIACLDIFDFTDDTINKQEFINKRGILFRKSHRWFFHEKYLFSIVDLYKNLLENCILKINRWMNEE